MKRTRTSVLSICSVLVTALALLLSVAPAQAATRTVHDTQGDAPARLDITRFTVTNTSASISAVIKVQHLGKTGVFQQRYFDAAFDSEPSYGVQVRRDKKGHLHVHAFRDDENGDNNIVCPGVKARWGVTRSRVVTSMPVSCANGVAFDPLHVQAASFDPGDIGVADSVHSFRVLRD